MVPTTPLPRPMPQPTGELIADEGPEAGGSHLGRAGGAGVLGKSEGQPPLGSGADAGLLPGGGDGGEREPKIAPAGSDGLGRPGPDDRAVAEVAPTTGAIGLIGSPDGSLTGLPLREGQGEAAPLVEGEEVGSGIEPPLGGEGGALGMEGAEEEEGPIGNEGEMAPSAAMAPLALGPGPASRTRLRNAEKGKSSQNGDSEISDDD